MANFFRDVLLPGSAAIGLLVSLALGPARAGEEPVVVARTAAIESSASTADRTCRRVDRLGTTTNWPCR